MQLGASGCGWCGHISQLTQPYLHYLVVTFCGGSFLLAIFLKLWYDSWACYSPTTKWMLSRFLSHFRCNTNSQRIL